MMKTVLRPRGEEFDPWVVYLDGERVYPRELKFNTSCFGSNVEWSLDGKEVWPVNDGDKWSFTSLRPLNLETVTLVFD